MSDILIRLLIHYSGFSGPMLFWLGLGYFGLLLFSVIILKNAFKRPTNYGLMSGSLPSVTVVVVIRNEAENLSNLIRSLLSQDYSGLWEVFIVDDNSTDNSVDIIRGIADSRILLKKYSAPPAGVSPKKWAISQAAQESSAQYVLTTDADCTPPPYWIEKMIEAVTTKPNRKMVLGPVVMESKGGLLQDIQAQQFAGVMAISFAFADKGNAFSGSAANLCFDRATFLTLGGYGGNSHKFGGDDVFLIEKFRQHHIDAIGICYEQEALIPTKTQNTWADFAKQSIRWASKFGSYKKLTGIIMALGLFFYHFTFVFHLGITVGITLLALTIQTTDSLSPLMESLGDSDLEELRLNTGAIYESLFWFGFVVEFWFVLLFQHLLRSYLEKKLLTQWYNQFKNKGNPQPSVAFNAIVYSFFAVWIGLLSVIKPNVAWKGRKTK